MAAAVGSKTEVTKLITVTLGKLQESKHAKCGLNLRKSLLVASVLHKARDIYVTEVKNRRFSSRVMDTTTTDSENNGDEDGNNKKPQTTVTPAKIRRFAVKRSMSVIEEEESNLSSQDDDSQNYLLSPNVPAETNDESEEDDDSSLTVIRPPKRLCSNASTSEEETQLAVDDILEELASENDAIDSSITTDKENNPPTNDPLLTSTAVSCGRCLKRRASTDYQDVCDQDNNNQDPYSSTQFSYAMKKRSRTNSMVASDSSNLEEAKSCAMDSTQINSLVNIFSQSFSEFSSTDSDAIYETSTEMNTFALCRDSIALTA